MTNHPLALLVCLGALVPAAVRAAETAPHRLSERLADEIRATLPNYDANRAEAGTTAAPTARSDPATVQLPKVHVRERATPRVDPDRMLSREELDRKKLREYKNSLTGLNSVLNGFSLPFVGPSMAARADEAYRARKRREEEERLWSVIQVAKSIDAPGAGELRQELIGAPDRPSLGRKR